MDGFAAMLCRYEEAQGERGGEMVGDGERKDKITRAPKSNKISHDKSEKRSSSRKQSTDYSISFELTPNEEDKRGYLELKTGKTNPINDPLLLFKWTRT
jgi:hypothetical protein